MGALWNPRAVTRTGSPGRARGGWSTNRGGASSARAGGRTGGGGGAGTEAALPRRGGREGRGRTAEGTGAVGRDWARTRYAGLAGGTSTNLPWGKSPLGASVRLSVLIAGNKTEASSFPKRVVRQAGPRVLHHSLPEADSLASVIRFLRGFSGRFLRGRYRMPRTFRFEHFTVAKSTPSRGLRRRAKQH